MLQLLLSGCVADATFVSSPDVGEGGCCRIEITTLNGMLIRVGVSERGFEVMGSTEGRVYESVEALLNEEDEGYKGALVAAVSRKLQDHTVEEK